MRKTYIDTKPLHFSRWKRKRYALFAALGKQVRIAALSVSMCSDLVINILHTGLLVNDGWWKKDTTGSGSFACLYVHYLISVKGIVCPEEEVRK